MDPEFGGVLPENWEQMYETILKGNSTPPEGYRKIKDCYYNDKEDDWWIPLSNRHRESALSLAKAMEKAGIEIPAVFPLDLFAFAWGCEDAGLVFRYRIMQTGAEDVHWFSVVGKNYVDYTGFTDDQIAEDLKKKLIENTKKYRIGYRGKDWPDS